MRLTKSSSCYVYSHTINKYFCVSVCSCVLGQIGCRTITSAGLNRFSPNFARGSIMWSARRLLFLWQTESRYPVLEMCKFRFEQLRDFGCHVFPQIVTKIWTELKLKINQCWFCTRLSTKPRNRKQHSELQIPFSVSTGFYPRDAMLARYCRHRVSVCTSIRLSVTSQCSTKMAKPTIMQTTPCNSPGTVVFDAENFGGIPKGSPLTRAPIRGGVG